MGEGGGHATLSTRHGRRSRASSCPPLPDALVETHPSASAALSRPSCATRWRWAASARPTRGSTRRSWARSSTGRTATRSSSSAATRSTTRRSRPSSPSAATTTGKPVLLHDLYADEKRPAFERLRTRGLPVYASADVAVRAAAALARGARARRERAAGAAGRWLLPEPGRYAGLPVALAELVERRESLAATRPHGGRRHAPPRSLRRAASARRARARAPTRRWRRPSASAIPVVLKRPRARPSSTRPRRAACASTCGGPMRCARRSRRSPRGTPEERSRVRVTPFRPRRASRCWSARAATRSSGRSCSWARAGGVARDGGRRSRSDAFPAPRRSGATMLEETGLARLLAGARGGAAPIPSGPRCARRARAARPRGPGGRGGRGQPVALRCRRLRGPRRPGPGLRAVSADRGRATRRGPGSSSLLGLMYASACGGPYGTEDFVAKVGPGLFMLLLVRDAVDLWGCPRRSPRPSCRTRRLGGRRLLPLGLRVPRAVLGLPGRRLEPASVLPRQRALSRPLRARGQPHARGHVARRGVADRGRSSSWSSPISTTGASRSRGRRPSA